MDICAHGMPGVVTPILTSELLGRIYQLNLDYLEFLIAEHVSAVPAGMRFLPERVLEDLCKTSHEARQKIATTAISLYSLGFEDQDFWRTALRFDEQPIDGRYGVLSASPMQSSFCELALLHAWHVAVTQPIAARMVYGMPTPIIDRMVRVRLWQLRRVAVDYPGLLMPRWPGNPCFWSDMINFAASGDSRRLHTLQQLGHQLIAIDLQSSADKRGAARERQRNLLTQRLLQSRSQR
ncbi:MAG TPA: hypothetical protein VNA21_14915 [Steroidobacteraceae bacterium]|nr:hypothetical protein [Steroidobacteraceae bacterium]